MVSPRVFAQTNKTIEDNNKSFEEIYNGQYKNSGADDLFNKLPAETKKELEKIGVNSPDYNSITNMKPQTIFSSIFDSFKDQSGTPLKVLAQVLIVILLCALIDGMKLSFGEGPLGKSVGLIGTLCICVTLIAPIASCIGNIADVVKGSSTFMIAYIPVSAALMISAGQPLTAASFNILMLTASEVISQIANWILIPMLNIFMCLSIISSISPNLNLNKISDLFSSLAKWILGIATTIFMGFLTVQNIVTVAADSTGTKAAKFAISGFIPVIGGALSDAFTTVQSCVKLLRSGVGAFALIAIFLIFIPIIIKCLLWTATVNIGAAIGDVFGVSSISALLKSISNVLSVMLAVLICCATVLLISTTIVLIIGGGGS
jgi:stage III sporulation protein AE